MEIPEPCGSSSGNIFDTRYGLCGRFSLQKNKIIFNGQNIKIEKIEKRPFTTLLRARWKHWDFKSWDFLFCGNLLVELTI